MVAQTSSTLIRFFGTLGNYGGNTQTIPLLPGSSAINAGNVTYCPTNDQRGKSRVGICDIGAFESQGFTLTKTNGDNQVTPINSAFANPLNVTLNETGGNVLLPGGTITFTAPTGGASIATPTTVATTTNASGIAALAVTANGTRRRS